MKRPYIKAPVDPSEKLEVRAYAYAKGLNESNLVRLAVFQYMAKYALTGARTDKYREKLQELEKEAAQRQDCTGKTIKDGGQRVVQFDRNSK